MFGSHFAAQFAKMLMALAITGASRRQHRYGSYQRRHRDGSKRGAVIGLRGKRRSSPAKVTRRPGLKALASYATQYSHVLTPLITVRRDRKGT